jgi:hypothetical protein
LSKSQSESVRLRNRERRALGVGGSVVGVLTFEGDGLAVGVGCPFNIAFAASGSETCNVFARRVFASDSCGRGWIGAAADAAAAEKFLAGRLTVGSGRLALRAMDGTRGRGGRLRRMEKVGFIAKLSIGGRAAQYRGTLAAAIAKRKDGGALVLCRA